MIHRIAIAALIAGLTAQLLKVVIEMLRTGRLNFLRFFDNGGMPSSHTALVTALTIGVGRYAGISSPLFAITFLFSLYFVFEAAGLRQEVGKQARLLNELADELRQTHHLDRKRLKELVGHTWNEVFGGFLFGVLVAAVAFR
ncbi:MAG: divergent PAP2 family protein [Candidatus Krumholzibacteria bacterium]|nr:divergent PAP2 family protein [Candidatus Krumholzibacteria bacterium]MDH4335980.1 divergent PAP2 family protein [Candidatus Krumholzibacteria bacterium]MDH5268444.1 divergent PAP2 family protein [Candidatus Krumholzibacteria bacterium]MDH5627200.1 divergent PAP2 family protein [Candidatus Krumholzibacteria bacterium]